MSGPSHSHHHQAFHDHSSGGHHSHAPSVNASNQWRVGLAALLTGGFMLAEVAGGLISGSLALLADAGHMLTDFAALAMAWGAFRLSARPANKNYTYGYDRVSILVAFVNALTLFGVAGWIVWEALQRILEPGEVLAGTMLWVAVAGLAVNLIVFWILMGADQENLNIRGAVLHVLGDLLGSIAAIAAALIILTTGWVHADPILSVLVAGLILRSAWALMRDSAHVLMQGTPKNLQASEIEADLLGNIEGLTRVDSARLWSLTPEKPVLTLRGYIQPSAEIETVTDEIKSRLSHHFHIDNTTIEIRVED